MRVEQYLCHLQSIISDHKPVYALISFDVSKKTDILDNKKAKKKNCVKHLIRYRNNFLFPSD